MAAVNASILSAIAEVKLWPTEREDLREDDFDRVLHTLPGWARTDRDWFDEEVSALGEQPVLHPLDGAKTIKTVEQASSSLTQMAARGARDSLIAKG